MASVACKLAVVRFTNLLGRVRTRTGPKVRDRAHVSGWTRPSTGVRVQRFEPLNLRSEPEPRGRRPSPPHTHTPIFADIINVAITTSLDRNKFQARVGLRIALCISRATWMSRPRWAYKRKRDGSLVAGAQGNVSGPWWMGNRCEFAFYWWCHPLTGSEATMFLSLWASMPTASFCRPHRPSPASMISLGDLPPGSQGAVPSQVGRTFSCDRRRDNR